MYAFLALSKVNIHFLLTKPSPLRSWIFYYFFFSTPEVPQINSSLKDYHAGLLKLHKSNLLNIPASSSCDLSFHSRSHWSLILHILKSWLTFTLYSGKRDKTDPQFIFTLANTPQEENAMHAIPPVCRPSTPCSPRTYEKLGCKSHQSPLRSRDWGA